MKYGLIIKILKRVSPFIFINLDKIDPNEEGLLDFCPMCETKLADKKVLTYKIHEKEKHGKTDEEVVRQYFRNPMILIFTILFVAIVVLVLMPPVMALFDEMNPTYTVDESCTHVGMLLKTRLYEQKQFLESDLSSLNYWYGSQCEYRDIWGNSTSVFYDKQLYDMRISELVEDGIIPKPVTISKPETP